MALTPYVVGQWVRDERFYGRRALLDEILEGQRNCLWILGTRRIGKTSILKQLERTTATDPNPRYVPIYWDFQGSESEEDLHEGFRDALYDAADRLDDLGIGLDEVDADDLFIALGHLRRALRRKDLSLLLLGDEVEELVAIHTGAPRLLRRLQRAFQAHEGIRTVLASTIRLWNLADTEGSTGLFLNGFTPPLAVRGLDDDAARDLIRQVKLPAEARPTLDDQTVEAIRERCNNHPYLLQLVSERLLELGDLDAAVEAIATDPMVSFFFDADLAMLGENERRIIQVIEEQDEATTDAIRERLREASASTSLQRLEQLGLVARSEQGVYRLANAFFRRWLGNLGHDSRARVFGALTEDMPTVAAPQTSAPHAEHDTRVATRNSAPNPVADPSPNDDNRVGDRYELLDRLGSGATGDVYKANDTLLRSVVAVKLLKPDYSADEEAVERLRREVVLARDLSHPNLLKIYHLGDDRGRKYITMPFVDGPDLAQVLAHEGPLGSARAVVLTAKLASALSALHRRQVLHRDIKPSNILLDQAGEPRITDFGLARLQAAPGVTQQGFFLGTPSYASPEQAVGDGLDERSDLYSLGIVLFEMLTGRLPFLAESVYEQLVLRLREDPPAPSQIRTSIPEALSSIVLRCLSRDPATRFQTARELRDALIGLGRS